MPPQRQCGFDRIELRRRNFAAATPMTNALNFVVDSGDFRAHFDSRGAARRIWPALPRAAGTARRSGRRRGVGFACHIKGTGGLPTENVDIRFEAGRHASR